MTVGKDVFEVFMISLTINNHLFKNMDQYAFITTSQPLRSRKD